MQQDEMQQQEYDIPTGVLTWGRFEQYVSPYIKNKDVWRIGTIADGSCYFHAILTATDKSYRGLEMVDREKGELERKQYIKEIRERLS